MSRVTADAAGGREVAVSSLRLAAAESDFRELGGCASGFVVQQWSGRSLMKVLRRIQSTVRPSRASSESVIALGICKAVYPVPGFAMQVRHGHDDDCISFLTINHAVREAAE
jgi:hypothetical protein